MKRAALFLLVLLLPTVFAVSQNSSAPDPYKPTLDRLDTLTRQAEPEWRFHTDIPHPEDPGVNDSDWSLITVKNVSGPGGNNANGEHWQGTCVFRRWIQVPEKINGYATQGAQAGQDLYAAPRQSSPRPPES